MSDSESSNIVVVDDRIVREIHAWTDAPATPLKTVAFFSGFCKRSLSLSEDKERSSLSSVRKNSSPFFLSCRCVSVKDSADASTVTREAKCTPKSTGNEVVSSDPLRKGGRGVELDPEAEIETFPLWQGFRIPRPPPFREKGGKGG